jgi:ADP-ribose pyrophosphatase YjhB (NUDIX family)
MKSLKPVVGVACWVFPLLKGTKTIKPSCIFIERNTPPSQFLWSVPGGKQEYGETVSEAAARETLEEVGLRVQVERIGFAVTDVIDENFHYSVVHMLGTVRVDHFDHLPSLVPGDDASQAAWMSYSQHQLLSDKFVKNSTEVLELALKNWPIRGYTVLSW